MSKGKLIIYWIATALLSFGMLGSGIMQIIHHPEMIKLVSSVGYPEYFLTIIGIWKVLGVTAILVPGFKLLKEWAYAGLFFVMTGAFFSHLGSGHYDIAELIGPVMQTIFITTSWYCMPAIRKIVTVNL